MSSLLLIDDNKLLLTCTTRYLEKAFPDLTLMTAECCANARELLEKHRPEVIVLDWLLPDGNGLSLLHHLPDAQSQSQVIVVSGELLSEHEKEALQGKRWSYLRKPYESQELLDAIRRALHLEEEPLPPPGWEGELSQNRPRFRRHRIINRLAGVLAGLRALGSDLHADAEDPDSVHQIADEYIERLIETVYEVSEMVHHSEIAE